MHLDFQSLMKPANVGIPPPIRIQGSEFGALNKIERIITYFSLITKKLKLETTKLFG